MRPLSRILGDDALAAQVARGNTAAEAELFARHHRAVIGFCRSILLDAHDADEAAQAAFVKALDALRGRPLDAPLRPWLFRIAHNESINLIRHRRRHEGLESAPPVVVPAADVAADQRERLNELVRDLQALPERQRSALLMREMSGFSYAEIATSLSSSEPAVRQTVFEARQALHEFREGRALECSSVRSVLEAGDRRVLRGKRLRAHLRGCPDCEALRAGVTTRRRDLRLLIPTLPASGLAALLGGGGAGGIATGGVIKVAVGAVAAMTATVGVVGVGTQAADPPRERHAVAQVHVERVRPPRRVHTEPERAAAAATATPKRNRRVTIPASFKRPRHVVAPPKTPHPEPKSPAQHGAPSSPGKPSNQGDSPLDSAAPTATPETVSTPAPTATSIPISLHLPISTNRQKTPAVADQALAQAQEQIAAAQAQVQAQMDAARAQTTAALQQAQAQIAAAQAQMQSLLAGFGQHERSVTP